MTENEKKYAEAFIKKKEQCNGKLTLLDWDDMTALRKELGLTIGQCDRVTKVVESIGLIEMHPMRQRGDIVLSNLSKKENNPYAALLDEIDKYITYADELIKDTISLQRKSDEIIQQVNETASIVANLAVDNYKKGNKREATILGGACAIVGLATWVYGKYEEAKLNERQEKQLAELLVKKQALARQKLPDIQQQYQRFHNGILAKTTKIFFSELQKDVNIADDTALQLQMFKSLFLIMIKSQYLDKTLEYIEGEMQAWLRGLQSSEDLFPLVAETVDDVIYSWYDDNIISRTEISDILNGAQKAKLASLFILSEPYLLRRHIGVKITNNAGFECDTLFASDHYDEPIIRSAYNSISYLYHDNNDYKIVKNKWTKYVTNSEYVTMCKNAINAAFVNAPLKGVVPRKRKIKSLILISVLCVIIYCFNPLYGIVCAILSYSGYKSDCKKIAEKLYPTQLQEFINDACKKVMNELDKFETNKL